MDNGNAQTYTEDRIKSPGAQQSPDLRTAGESAAVEPASSRDNQVVLPDAAGVSSGKEPSSAPERLEKRPGHREASDEGPLELRTQEQSHLVDLGKKLSSWAPQEGPEELQAGQNPATPGSELGVLPSRVPAAPEGLQDQGSGKEIKDLQGRPQNPGTVEGQAPSRCQPTPGHQAANRSDLVQTTEPPYILDSCGQYLEEKPLQEADTPPSGLQGNLPEAGPGGDKDSSQEAMPPMPTTSEEKTGRSFLPSTPGPNTPKEGVKPAEAKPASEPVPPPEVRDIGDRRELGCALKQPQEPTAAAGAQNLGSTWQSFMRCLLEVVEEEASHRKAAKARALPNRKSPKTLTPVPTSAPVGNSASSLPLTLPQTPASAPASAPSWARLPVPGSIPAPVGAPVPPLAPATVLPAPALDPGWRRTVFFHHSGGERSLSYVKARQELEECSLLTLYQNWEGRPEEHLTLKQEEAFHSYFEIFNGPGEVDARSLEYVLLHVGISLTPAQVKDALMSADIDGDGHVGFKDFLAVLTDTKRFFSSVEQNALTAPPNPHTLLFEILSLVVEMLALPEAALEEITNYYQKKLKEGTCKAREMESAIGRLRSRKKLPYSLQQADTLDTQERRVLRILNRLKQQNCAANLQSPYAQVPCIPLCPRLDKKMVGRKQGSQYMLDQCTASLSSDIHSLFLQSGSQGSREHSSDSRKWLSSVPARTH